MRLVKRDQKKKLMLQWITAALSILLGLSFELNAVSGYASPEELNASLTAHSSSFKIDHKNHFSDQNFSNTYFSHENTESEPFEKEIDSEDIVPECWQEIKFNQFNTAIGSFQPKSRSDFHKVPLYIQYRSLKIHLS